MKNYLLSILYVILFSLQLHSQDTLHTTVYQYFQDNEGLGNKITLYSDSSILVLGASWNPGPLYGATITKFSKDGDVTWQNKFDTPFFNFPQSELTTNNGDIYVPITDTRIQALGGYQSTIILAKYKSDGTIVYEKEIKDSTGRVQRIAKMGYNGSNRLFLFSHNKSKDSILVADLLSFSIIKPGGVVEKINDISMPESFMANPIKLVLTEDSIIYRCGYRVGTNPESRGLATFVFDYNTNLLNQYRSDSLINIGLADRMKYDNFANAYKFNTHDINNIEIQKITPQLDISTFCTISAEPNHSFYTIDMTMADWGPKYISWSEYDSISSTVKTAYIAQLDITGQIVWKSPIPVLDHNPSIYFFIEKSVLFDGGMVGMYDYYNLDSTSYVEPFVFQITEDGSKFFSWAVDLISDYNYAKDMVIDQESNIIITGERSFLGPQEDGMFVAKISPPLYIQTSNTTETKWQAPFAEIAVSPNPFQSNTKLELSRKRSINEDIRIKIIDMQGKVAFSRSAEINTEREVFELDNLSLPSGSYWFTVQGAKWSVAEQVVVVN